MNKSAHIHQPASGLRNTPMLHWYLIACGAMGYFFGQPNPFVSFPLLALLSPFALFCLAHKATTAKQSFLQGWCLGALGLGAAMYWLVYPIHQVGGLPILLAIPCIILVGIYLGLYTGATALGMFHVQRSICCSSATSTSYVQHITSTLLCGCIFAGFEVLVGMLFSGFPWYTLGTAFIPWISWPQLAHSIGNYGLSALFACAACLLATIYTSPKAKVFSLIAGCALLSAIPLYGHIRLASRVEPATPAPALHVGLIQGNIDQNKKWNTQLVQDTIHTYCQLSEKALATQASQNRPPLDLILWPETAMPFMFDHSPEFSQQLTEFAKANAVYLGVGTLGYKYPTPAAPQRIFNRLQFISPQGVGTYAYDKQHLVPFGEYVPFALDIPFLRNILQGIDFAPGSTQTPFALFPQAWLNPNTGLPAPDATTPFRLGVLICYEVIFPNMAHDRVKQGATILATISNDAWFQESSAPWQHLNMAAMRCIEQMRPMLRSTNTGVTATISPYGNITHYGTLFTEDAFVVSITPEKEHTFFYTYGYAIQYFLLGIAILSIVLQPIRKKFFSF